jgi:transcriptional regulator with XRE-family HTH domain
MVRALSGLSRQELHEKVGIGKATIDAWESGRVELTEKSSAKMREALKKVGVYCSAEWILTGIGDPPRVMKDIEKSIFTFGEINDCFNENIAREVSKIPSHLKEDIRRELSFFIDTHKDALFCVLEEDLEDTRLKKGDCVAGEAGDLKKLEGRMVITQLSDGTTALRRLPRCEETESKVKILKAAEIIWFRRMNEKETESL